MRQRRPIPVQRRIDIRARAVVVEDPIVTSREEHVESVWVAVTASAVSVVKRDVGPPLTASKDGESLRFEKRRLGHRFDRVGHNRARKEQRAPAQVGARER
jgi:hypothetical protein